MPKSTFRVIMEKTAELGELYTEVGVLDLFAEILALLDRNLSVKALVWYQNDLGYITSDCGARAGLPWGMAGFRAVHGTFPEFGEKQPGVDYFDDAYLESGRPRASVKERARVMKFINALPEKLLADYLGTNVVVFAWRGGILTRSIV